VKLYAKNFSLEQTKCSPLKRTKHIGRKIKKLDQLRRTGMKQITKQKINIANVGVDQH